MGTTWRTRLIRTEARAPDGFRSLVTPVFRGSTTLLPRAASIVDTWDHDATPYTYGSYGTPTTLELAARIAELEGGHRCFIAPGGQSALLLVYLAFVGAGEHVLVPESVYGPSRAFADQVLRRLGAEVEFYPPLEGGRIASRIRNNTRLVWCESPGSLTMEVQDVPAIVEAAHARRVPVALDNTWAAGVLFDAFGHGVDVSVQALTKYVGGHSDLLLGSVTLRDDALYRRVGAMRQHLGLSVSPDECSLALRGLQTLHVRLRAIEESALRVAAWFAARSDVESVLHPALPSCPGHETWKRDFSGSSGLFSVVFRPPLSGAELKVSLDRLRLFRMGYSWGGVASLAVTPDPDEAPNARVYADRLVRFHVGLEDPDDLIADLDRAFHRGVARGDGRARRGGGHSGIAPEGGCGARGRRERRRSTTTVATAPVAARATTAPSWETKTWSGSRARSVDDRVRPLAAEAAGGRVCFDFSPGETACVPDPAYRVRDLRLNVVLRWEHRPGSALFVVWTQERHRAPAADTRFATARDRFGVLDAKPSNTFLVKFSYWLARQ